MPSAVMRFLPTPRATESDESPATFRARTRTLQTKPARSGGQTGPCLGVVAQEQSRWHEYAPAIHRWEEWFGPAPEPLEPNRAGNPRLAPAFSEWMMGIPAGRVTDPALGLTRNEQLMCIGNGVVPAQAAAATRWFLHSGYPAARALTEQACPAREGRPAEENSLASA